MLFLWSGCDQHNPEELDSFTRNQINVWNKNLTSVIISDIFTPPVAARIYVYSHIAGYETMAAFDSDYLTLAGQLNGFDEIPAPPAPDQIYPPLAAINAFVQTGKHLVYNTDALEEEFQKVLQRIDEIGIDDEIFENSLAYGQQVSQHVIEWTKNDGYIERQAMPRYVLEDDPGKWQPTPPDYMPGIEPHWKTIRPLVLDSVNQFVPPPPTPFDTAKNSLFYQETMEVYEAVKSLDDERLEIAKFWDCNPNISFTKGHVMFYHQKISPGGHWLSIASIATQMEDLDMLERLKVFTLTSIALNDAFISCWDEKYRSSLVRPETYIDRYIDPDWRPILQTPAFPEYTSGHSVISSAAATALTHLLGDSFSFADSSEVDFGLPIRHFDSFYGASEEAAISRLYGGIHYRPAIENGVEQGIKVGKLINNRIKFHPDQLAKDE